MLPIPNERIAVKTSQSRTTSTCTAGLYVAQLYSGTVGDVMNVNYVGYIEKIQMLNFLWDVVAGGEA